MVIGSLTCAWGLRPSARRKCVRRRGQLQEQGLHSTASLVLYAWQLELKDKLVRSGHIYQKAFIYLTHLEEIMELKAWQLESKDGNVVISVTSCDLETAFIAVFRKTRTNDRGGNVGYEVILPSFERMVWQKDKKHWSDMPVAVYSRYLDENRTEILSLIEKLNSPDYPKAGSGASSI